MVCLSLKKSYTTAVLGGSAYSPVGIKSPYEQIVRIDGIRKIDDTDLDLFHLASPAVFTRGVSPLTIPLFQPSPGVNDTCYAVGYGSERGNQTEIALLRRSAGDSQYEDDNILCLNVTRKPQSCLVNTDYNNILFYF